MILINILLTACMEIIFNYVYFLYVYVYIFIHVYTYICNIKD